MTSSLSREEAYRVRSAKGRITQVITLTEAILGKADEFKEPFQFPSERDNCTEFIDKTSVKLKSVLSEVEEIVEKLQKIDEDIVFNLLRKIEDEEEKEEASIQLDQHIADKNVEAYVEIALDTILNLRKRKTELETQKELNALQIQNSLPSNNPNEIKPTVNATVSNSPSIQQQVPPAPQTPFNPFIQQTPFQTPFAQNQTPSNPSPQPDLAYALNNLAISLQANNQSLAHVYNKTFKIPDFSGKPSEFQNFYNMFMELVDKKQVDNLEKLAVLLSCCKGEARAALELIPRSAAGYHLALVRLRELFADPYAIRNELIHRMETLEKASGDSASLIQTLTTIQTIVSRLSMVGDEVNSAMIQKQIFNKFPPRIQDKILDKQFELSSTPTTQQFLAIIEKIVKLSIHKQMFSESEIKDNQTVLHTSISKRCVGCDGTSHFLKECRQYPTAKEKKARLSLLKRCFLCFARGHLADSCPSTVANCGICKERHNYILCNRYDPQYRNRHSHSGHRSRRDSFYQKNRDRSHSRLRRMSSGRNEPRSRSRNSFRSQSRPGRSSSRNRVEFSENNRQNQRSRSQGRSRSQNRASSQNRNPHQSRSRSRGNEYRVNVALTSGESKPVSVPEEQIQLNSQGPVKTRMKLVYVNIKNENTGQQEKVVALLDGAGQTSFIRSETASRLGLATYGDADVSIISFGGIKTKTKAQKTKAMLFDENCNPFPVNLLTTKRISDEIDTDQLSYKDIAYMKDQGIKTNKILRLSDDKCEPDILLGLEYYDLITTVNKPAYKLPSGLYAKPTCFGYIVSGAKRCTVTFDTENTTSVLRTFTTMIEESKFDQLWKLDAIGVTEDLSLQTENEKAIEHYKKTYQIKNGKIYVKFPFNDNIDKLKSNFNVAFSRIHALCKLRETNPEVWQKYVENMQQQIDNRDVEVAEGRVPGRPIFYIPHHVVFKKTDNTEKTSFRIVLDASSNKAGEFSLNDCIHQGPTLLPSILGIMIRARTSKYLLLGDIQKAFHQIHLQEEDRDVARILWLKDPSRGPEDDNLLVLRYRKLPFGINASPFLLAMSIIVALEQKPEQKLVREIIDNIYVDDLTLKAETQEELLDNYRQSKKLFQEIGMNMREYISNCPSVNNQIPKEDFSHSSSTKLLGVPWDTVADTLKITIKCPYEPNGTKRTVLASANSTFDPIGFSIPLVLPCKILVQEVWERGLDWNHTIDSDLDQKWKEISEKIHETTLEVPRRVIPDPSQVISYELHSFVDASVKAYAVAIYLVTIDKNNQKTSNLILARYRLTPLKDITNPKGVSIPRLELLAFTIGMELTKFAHKELQLKISKIQVYGDSQIALFWIHNHQGKGTFIQNRVKRIRDIREQFEKQKIICSFEYTATDQNPADLATRGVDKSELQNNLWWKGPDFLTNPKALKKEAPKFQFKEEMTKETVTHCFVNQNNDFSKSESEILDKVRTERDFHKVRLSTLEELRQRKTNPNVDREDFSLMDKEWTLLQKKGPPTAEEIQISESFLIRSAQKSFTNHSFPQFNTFKDGEGILRCKSRLEKSELQLGATEPILLPPNHWLTDAIIRFHHVKVGHSKTATLPHIRNEYEIPHIRAQVKKALKKCPDCQRLNNKPYKRPRMPPLPASRVNRSSRPFENIGLDYAGPIHLSNTVEGITTHIKHWVAIFTCTSTRAIHLELVPDLSAHQFLLAFKRIMSIRGQPKLVYSDNASTFHAGQEIIDKFSYPHIEEFSRFPQIIAPYKTKWEFITPLSPWKGGFYERLIRNVKETLRKMKKLKRLSIEEFRTVLAEVAMMVNSRPLTYVSSGPEDTVIIRPIDFLTPKIELSNLKTTLDQSPTDDPEYIPNINSKDQAVARFDATLQYTEEVWNIWREHYLKELRQHHKQWPKRRSAQSGPQLNDIVLMVDELKPRDEWRLAKIIRLIESEDGEIRSVAVSTAQGKEFVRSVNLLVPLELNSSDIPLEFRQNDGSPEPPSGDQNDPPDQNKENGPPLPVKDQKDSPARKQPHRKTKENVRYVMTTAVEERIHRKPLNWNSLSKLGVFLAILSLVIAPSQAFNVACSKGGVQITGLEPLADTEVCGEADCRILKTPQKNQSIIFNGEVTLSEYKTTVKSLFNDTEKSVSITCPSSPFCDQIECTFCWATILNPECAIQSALLSMGLLTYALGLSLYITRKLVGKASKLVFSLVQLQYQYLVRLIKIFWCSEEQPYIKINKEGIKLKTKARSSWASSNLIKIAVVTSILTGAVDCCQDTIQMTGKVNKCYDQQNCTEFEALSVNLNMLKPQTCIQLRDTETQIVNQIKLTVKGVLLTCQKESLFFTQNRKPRVDEAKRCSYAGSCKSPQTCSRIRPDSEIEELAAAKNLTGTTYCADSCGGLWCGCAFDSPGCLFYKVSFPPSDTRPFAIIKCASWNPEVLVDYEYISEDGTHVRNLRLTPNTEWSLNGTRLIVNQVIYYPLPLLNNRFAINEDLTAIIEDQDTFQFYCKNKSASGELTECSAKDTCNCRPARNNISCYCEKNEIKYSVSNVLPVIRPGFRIEQIDTSITAFSETASADLTITLNTSLAEPKSKIDTDTCVVYNNSVTGCYKCASGAFINITCRSTRKTHIGSVQCRSQNFAVLCTPDGEINHIRMAAETADFVEDCALNCGNISDSFHLTGTLQYVHGLDPFKQLFNAEAQAYQTRSGNGTDSILDAVVSSWNSISSGITGILPDFNHIWQEIKRYAITALVIFVGATIALFLTILAISSCLADSKAGKTTQKASIVAPPLKMAFIVLWATRKIARMLLFVPLLAARAITKALRRI